MISLEGMIYRPTKREVVCLGTALALHLILFFWKGGLLNLSHPDLGQAVVQVQFLNNVPEWHQSGTPSNAQEQKTLFGRMKTFFTKPKAEPVAALKTQSKIKVDKPIWEKVDKTVAGMKLKQNKKFAGLIRNSTPFKIQNNSKFDKLANENAVLVQTTKTPQKAFAMKTDTSRAPVFKTKEFSGLQGGSFSKGGLQAGGGAIKGTGKVGGSLPRRGRSSGKIGGAWTGGTSMSTLSRNTAVGPTQTVRGPGGRKSAFSIQGALANRHIEGKTLPPYEFDSRVALRFRVNASGRVLHGIVLEVSSGYPSFDRKVMNALKKWIFSKLPSSRSNEVQEGVITFNFRGV